MTTPIMQKIKHLWNLLTSSAYRAFWSVSESAKSLDVLNNQAMQNREMSNYPPAAMTRPDTTDVSPEDRKILRDFANDLIECGMVNEAMMYGVIPFATQFKEGSRLQSNGKFTFTKKRRELPRNTVAIVSNIE